jgi:hypothetical protein
MTNNELIILLLGVIILIFLITTNKNENFEKVAPITKNEEISVFWQLRGYTVREVPNFYKIFGSNDLSKYFEYPGNENWKLFTNTPLFTNESLASLLRSNSPKTYNDDNRPILTGFIRSTNIIIGIMTPTNITPSGQWLKSIKWERVNDVSKNAKNVIIWANQKNTTDIKLNNNGTLADAIKIHEFEIPNDFTSGPVFNIDIANYKSINNTPFTTYYLQILDNWGDPYTVKINNLILNYEI